MLYSRTATAIVILACAAIGSAAAEMVNAPEKNALVADVTCVEIQFAKAVANADKARFASLINDDARFVSDGAIRGREAILKAWEPFLTPGGPEIAWRPMIVEVLKSGDLALSRGPYRVRSTDKDGTVRESWGTYNSIWQRQRDGQWQVIFDAGNEVADTFPDAVKELITTPRDDCEGES